VHSLRSRVLGATHELRICILIDTIATLFVRHQVNGPVICGLRITRKKPFGLGLCPQSRYGKITAKFSAGR
jgi:hypothetical protein